MRTPTMLQPHLDMKHFLQFPMETAHHPHSMNLFHNFNTAQTHTSPSSTHTGGEMQLQASTDTQEKKMDPVQKAVINHTFGVPLVKTKRPVISCNVCQIRFNSESQAEAHYKGNRHARRVKGIETSKSRPQEGDKPHTVPPTSSPSPPGALGPATDNEPSKADETRPLSQLTCPCWPRGPLPSYRPPLPYPWTALMPSVCPYCPPHSSSDPTVPSSPGCGTAAQLRAAWMDPCSGAVGSTAPSPSIQRQRRTRPRSCCTAHCARWLSNSPSQLEAHNKGTKHKTILEARSGLGPIKAYPRLGPKPIGEQAGGPVDPNTQERTFHCEICNVRVNSELQLKQSSLTFSKDLSKALGAGLLPSPLAVAAAMAAAASSNQLALRAAAPGHHHHHHLLQGPPLSHAILRPAPGPMRTTHGPILFSPY
ncbi:hypothetical protein F7725_000676 [Dissostichus mawsoni]|uniref:C2H2-type domain-containing protein n=1 Tax=Dissostichus mawsoni TaxID=36200 RepID=A0A7J5ZH19_DISMA|nr:hypothetical protein F7725_000676 [Dissostichus mawsoni]